MSEDKRIKPRMRTVLAARVEINNGDSTFDCTVRNLSDTGARIKVEAPHTLPETFQIYIIKSDVRYKCEIKWRTVTEVGVHFIS